MKLLLAEKLMRRRSLCTNLASIDTHPQPLIWIVFSGMERDIAALKLEVYSSLSILHATRELFNLKRFVPDRRRSCSRRSRGPRSPETRCKNRIHLEFHTSDPSNLIIRPAQTAAKSLARQVVTLRQRIDKLQGGRAQIRGIAIHTQVNIKFFHFWGYSSFQLYHLIAVDVCQHFRGNRIAERIQRNAKYK